MFVINLSRIRSKNPSGYFFCGYGTLGIHKSGISSAIRYDSISSAQKQLKELVELHKLNRVDDFTVDDDWDNYRIIAEDSIPYHDSWENAFPIDINHLHEAGRPVRIVPRCGWSKKQQVSGSFLRDQVLAGFNYFNDGFSRWEYDDER
jgi:hypothetical protein